MEPPFIVKVFDWIGTFAFHRQQDWERRRNAKIMTTAVTLGLVLGLACVKVIKHMNAVNR